MKGPRPFRRNHPKRIIWAGDLEAWMRSPWRRAWVWVQVRYHLAMARALAWLATFLRRVIS